MSPSGIQSDHFQNSRAQLGRELREIRQLHSCVWWLGWPAGARVLGHVLPKSARSPCWSQHGDQVAQKRKRLSYSHLLLREEVMNVSTNPAGAPRQIRSPLEETQEPQDNHRTGGLLGASRPVFSFSSCAMFPPQQTFPRDKWKES